MPIDDLFNDLKEKEKEIDIVKKRLADIFYEKERPFNNGKIKRYQEAEKSKEGIKKFKDEVTNGYGFKDENGIPEIYYEELDNLDDPAITYLYERKRKFITFDKSSELMLQLHLGYLESRDHVTHRVCLGKIAPHMIEVARLHTILLGYQSYIDNNKKFSRKNDKSIKTPEELENAVAAMKQIEKLSPLAKLTKYSDIKRVSKENNLDKNIVIQMSVNSDFYAPSFNQLMKENLESFAINAVSGFIIGAVIKGFSGRLLNPLIYSSSYTVIKDTLDIPLSKYTLNKAFRKSPGEFLGYTLGFGLVSLLPIPIFNK